MIECSGNPLKFDTNYLTTFTEKLEPFSTIKIGNQEWMLKNLAVDDGFGGITTGHYVVNGVDFGIQYKYSWNAAQRIADTITGFYLPTSGDFNTLFNNVGGSSIAGYNLKSKSGWLNNGNGINEIGFNALPLEYLNYNSANSAGAYSIFWTQTHYYDTGNNYIFAAAGMYDNFSAMAGLRTNRDNDLYFPIRLLKEVR